MNIYKQILSENLSRLLNLYNLDKFSTTYGIGDREYWGWKTKDFANATMQGGVHSLAIAIKLELFTAEEKRKVLDVIDSVINATSNITYSNGSMEEAYPAENSFCVTALVAFDILSALNYLQDEIIIDKYFDIIRPLINFITVNNEEHAVISNHLATAVAAIALWNKLTESDNCHANELLAIIYKQQSSEGWYREYDGADPAYQTLCTYYLYCAYEITQDKKLLKSLEKSARFLKHFIHPDGSIGGLYGSRNTEVFYPAGIISLAEKIDDFALMAKYLEPKEQHILPQEIDIGNFIPLLNSYAVAAINFEQSKAAIKKCKLKAFWQCEDEKDFQGAGLFLHSNKHYFAVINYKKGGTIKIFDKNSKQVFEDGGLFGVLNNNKKFSTQAFENNINFDDFIIKTDFYLSGEDYPTPLKFIILRALSLTIFKSVFLGNLFKKIIVKKLMTGKNKIDGHVIRKFTFEEDRLLIEEKIQQPKNTKWIKHLGKSKAIHMASSGYFNKQSFRQKNALIEFKEIR